MCQSKTSRGATGIQLLVVVAYLVLGFISLAANRDQPIVRNSVLYARIADACIDGDAAFFAESGAYRKALGFPLLSKPFVAKWGANIGLKGSSYIWTSCWILSVFYLFSRFSKRGMWDGSANLVTGSALLIFLLNPLVYYQFISGYPDSLDALSFLWAVIFLDRFLSEHGKWYDGLCFSAATLLAIWVKQHGFVILAILPVFLLSRKSLVKTLWKEKPKTMYVGILSLALLFGILSAAQLGKIPGFNITSSAEEYGGGDSGIAFNMFLGTKMALGYAFLSLSVLAPLLIHWPQWRTRKEWYWAVIVFVATLLPYYGSAYNPRYLLPISPFLAWIVANNLTRLPRAAIQVLVPTFVMLNGFTTTYYNSRAVFERAAPVLQLPLPENLRLNNGQRRADDVLAEIRKQEKGGLKTLYFVSHYYGDGMWYVWQNEGLISPAIAVTYFKSLEWDAMKSDAIRRGIRRALVYAPSEHFYLDEIPEDVCLTPIVGDGLYVIDFLNGA